MVRLANVSTALFLVIGTLSTAASVKMEGSNAGGWTNPQTTDNGMQPTLTSNTPPALSDMSIPETMTTSSSSPPATEQPQLSSPNLPPTSPPSSPPPIARAPAATPPPTSASTSGPAALDTPSPIPSTPAPDTTVTRPSESPTETPKPSSSVPQPVSGPTSPESSSASIPHRTPSDTPDVTSTPVPPSINPNPTSAVPEPVPTSKPDPILTTTTTPPATIRPSTTSTSEPPGLTPTSSNPPTLELPSTEKPTLTPKPTSPQPVPSATSPAMPKPSPTTPEPAPTTRTPTATPGPPQTTPEPSPITRTPSPTTPEPNPTAQTPSPKPNPTTPKPSPTTPEPAPTTQTPKPSPTSPEPKPTTRTPSPKPSPTPPEPNPTAQTPSPKPNPTTPKPSPTTPEPAPTTQTPKPSPTSPEPKPTTRTPSPKPSPTPPEPNPTAQTPSPKPNPTTPKPSPTTPEPAPTTQTPKPSPTSPEPKPTTRTPSPKPSPTPPEPNPTAQTPSPKPNPTTPKPSPTTPEPAPTTQTPKPSPTSPEPKPTTRTPSPKPSPTPPEPNPTAQTPSPKPNPTTPKPSPTTPEPAPTTQTPKPSPTSPEPKPTTRTPSPKPSPTPPEPNPTTRTPTPKPSATTLIPSTRKPSPKPTSDEPASTPAPQKTTPIPTRSKPTSLPMPTVTESDTPGVASKTPKPVPTTRPSTTKAPVSSTAQPKTPVPAGTKLSARDIDNDDFSEDAETPTPTPKTKPRPNPQPTKTPVASNSPKPTRSQKSEAQTPKTTTKTPSPLAQQIITGTVKPKEDSQGGALAQDLSTTPTTTGVMVIEQANKGSESARETSTAITFRNDTHEETYIKYDRSTFKRIEEPVEVTNGTTGSYFDGSDTQTKPNVVIGGRNRKHVAPGADVAVSAFTQDAQDAMRFASYGFTIVSAVLLMLYHLLALFGPVWLPVGRGTNKISSWLTPNTWELIVVFGFFQHLGSISMLELTKAPYFVLDFTDSFSWTNYHLYSMGGGVVRRLENVILTGMVAYADRLGVEETSLLAYTTHFFLAVVGILLVCFFVAMVYHRKVTQSNMRDTNAMHEPQREYALYLLGLGTALWMLSVFPLTAISSYELHMELRYTVGGNIAIVLFNLIGVVVGGSVFFLWRVRSLRTDVAMSHRHISTLGALYADKKRGARFFFMVVILFEMLSGMFVGAVQGSPDQLIALLAVHGAFIVVIGVIRPYHDRIANICVSLFMMLRIVNLLLATSFLTESEMETAKRGSISNTFVAVNFTVILLICFRQLLVFVYVLRMWSSHDKDDDSKNNFDEDHDLSDLGEDGHHVELQSTRRCGAIVSDLAPVSLPPTSAQHRYPALPTPCTGQAAFTDSPVPNFAHRTELPPFRENYD